MYNVYKYMYICIDMYCIFRVVQRFSMQPSTPDSVITVKPCRARSAQKRLARIERENQQLDGVSSTRAKIRCAKDCDDTAIVF